MNTSHEPVPHVVVVGGGISGLTTAWHLARAGTTPVKVTVLESADRLGGKIDTIRIAGVPVDTGPDAFLSRAPALGTLIDDLGLRSLVVNPTASGAYVYSRGKLRALPPGAAFGVPERLLPLLRSGLLSPLGLARAGLDLVLPARVIPADPSVADLTATRFGKQCFERLIAPLLGGVHAGDARTLSANATVPEIAALARANRSLYLGLRAKRRTAARSVTPAEGPQTRTGTPVSPLVTIDGGLTGLVTALVDALESRVSVRTGATVATIAPDGQRWRLTLTDGHVVHADAIVLAVPAYVAATLLTALSPVASETLERIGYADVASVTLAFPAGAMDLLAGTGYLLPASEHTLLVGVTWTSQKWAHAAGDSIIVRCLVGRAGDSRWRELGDDALVSAVVDELAHQHGRPVGAPCEAVVTRWVGGMPQYNVGHHDKLETLTDELAALPGLHLTGAAYRGVGLAGCVADAATTATAVLAGLHTPLSVKAGASG